MKYNKIKHEMDEKEDTEFCLWVRFGDIEYIYPVDRSNAKVTREELEKENKDRWIEIPNDCLKINLNRYHNLILIEKRQDDGHGLVRRVMIGEKPNKLEILLMQWMTKGNGMRA